MLYICNRHTDNMINFSVLIPASRHGTRSTRSRQNIDLNNLAEPLDALPGSLLECIAAKIVKFLQALKFLQPLVWVVLFMVSSFVTDVHKFEGNINLFYAQETRKPYKIRVFSSLKCAKILKIHLIHYL